MPSVLVTGGAGFIGSHIAERLADLGHEVRVLDNFSTGKRENLASFAGRVTVIEADIRDLAALKNAARGVDVVFHEAALASVPRSVDDPVTSDEVNVHGTLNVLVAARDAGVRRVVYASSSSIYGNSPELPKREDMTPAPESPYAAGKLAGELYCSVFSLSVPAPVRRPPLLQRLRAAPGSVVAVRGRRAALHEGAPPRGAARHLRRRRAVARFHVRPERRGREPRRGGARRARWGRS